MQPEREVEAAARSWIDRVRGVLANVDSVALAMRGMRVHIEVAEDGQWLTVDCSTPNPTVEEGHRGSAHAVASISRRDVPAFVAAYSFEQVFESFREGTMRWTHGTCLQMMFYLRERPNDCSNDELRNALERAMQF